MKGNVDERNRALVSILVGNELSGKYESVTVWIDTAFDGHLVFPTSLIQQLELESLAETEAILADGSKVSLDSYLCYLDWFGQRIAVTVIANEGRFPLLGTELLIGRELTINYVTKMLTLE